MTLAISGPSVAHELRIFDARTSREHPSNVYTCARVSSRCARINAGRMQSAGIRGPIDAYDANRNGATPYLRPAKYMNIPFVHCSEMQPECVATYLFPYPASVHTRRNTNALEICPSDVE